MTVMIRESFMPLQKSRVLAALRKLSTDKCVGIQVTVASTRSSVSIKLTESIYSRG